MSISSPAGTLPPPQSIWTSYTYDHTYHRGAPLPTLGMVLHTTSARGVLLPPHPGQVQRFGRLGVAYCPLLLPVVFSCPHTLARFSVSAVSGIAYCPLLLPVGFSCPHTLARFSVSAVSGVAYCPLLLPVGFSCPHTLARFSVSAVSGIARSALVHLGGYLDRLGFVSSRRRIAGDVPGARDSADACRYSWIDICGSGDRPDQLIRFAHVTDRSHSPVSSRLVIISESNVRCAARLCTDAPFSFGLG